MAASAMIGVGNVDAIVDKICDEERKIIPVIN
jgi:malonate-semialdehyde dehydrogenase (acetylating)/methylmalonate-semialdehyde dehydrogenase